MIMTFIKLVCPLSWFLGDGYCNLGYTGPLCAVCELDWYFDPNTNACLSCLAPADGDDAGGPVTPTNIVGLALLVIAAIGALLYWRNRRWSRVAQARAADEAKKAESEGRVPELSTMHLMIRKKLFKNMKNPPKFIVHPDGSVSFTIKSSLTSPVNAETEVSEVSTPIAKIITSTTTATAQEVATVKTTVVKPQSPVAAYVAKIKAAQVKIKSFTSFGQIAVNISCECAFFVACVTCLPPCPFRITC